MSKQKTNKLIIIVVSILVPILVAFLFLHTKENADVGEWVSFLPSLNALINSTTAVLLVLGVVFIKKRE